MRRDLIIVGVTIVTTLFVLELVTRWLLRDITTTGDNTSYFAARWRANGAVRLNRFGYRDDDFTPVPAPGVFRIATVGDSFTYGQGIASDARMTEQLQERLNAGGSVTFEVLNFGVPGANYDRHLVTLRSALHSAQPDFVLLQWYKNDLLDPGVRPPRSRSLGWYLHRYLHPRSALYVLANEAFTRAQYTLGLVPAEEDYYLAQFRDPDGPAAARARRRLEDVLDLARDQHTPLAMILWPTVAGRVIDFASEDFLIRQVLDVCRHRRLSCVDLRPALATGAERLAVNRFDGHPSASANRLAAEVVLERFEALWLDAATTKRRRRPRAGHGRRNAVTAGPRPSCARNPRTAVRESKELSDACARNR
jgi:hypothetical protein